jgi:hypothetical protein
MNIGLLFWVLMILTVVFSLFTAPRPFNAISWGGSLLVFVLLALLGWRVFGPALHN